jgi:hypothetical protein
MDRARARRPRPGRGGSVGCSDNNGSGDDAGDPFPRDVAGDARNDLGGADAGPPDDLGGFDAGEGGVGDIPPVMLDRPMPVDTGPTACSAAGCPTGQVCVDEVCLPDRGPCTTNDDCRNDSRCATPANRCVPFGVGATDPSCTREIRPGVFAPAVQCRFSEAPPGDAFPAHLHVLATPMVADLRVYRDPDTPARPSIIAVFDDGEDGGSELGTGLIRILDGRTCTLQDNLSMQLVSHSSPVAVGDLDGDGRPEIVAFKAGGGLVAFHYVLNTPDPDAGVAGDGAVSDAALDAGVDAGAEDVAPDAADGDVEEAGPVDAGPPPPRGRWEVLWRSTRDGTAFNPTGGGWAGPTLVDLDNDGLPEVLRHGMVFDGRTGAYLGGESETPAIRGYSAGGFSVVVDIDEDDEMELVTGAGVARWDVPTRAWVRESWYSRTECTGAGCGIGHVAVANFGAYTSARVSDPAMPEVAVVSAGHVRVDTMDGRTVFGPVALPGGGTGGPPTVADFDGDGLPEIAAAGATAYTVFDPDCAPVSTLARLGRALRRDGAYGGAVVAPVAGHEQQRDGLDELRLRGRRPRGGGVRRRVLRAGVRRAHGHGALLAAPLVVHLVRESRGGRRRRRPARRARGGEQLQLRLDHDGHRVSGRGPRNTDVQFAGIRCATGTDCPSGVCVEGFCRCLADRECCPGRTEDAGPGTECTYVCAAPPEGTPGSGNTCRASRPVGVRGIRVYSDIADRWVGSRMIWNQHTYHVTNVNDDGRVPASGAVRRNWRERSLNNFRTNVQGSAETMRSGDATGAGEGFMCLASGAARLTFRACNRGTAPLPDALPVGLYDRDPAAMGATPVCRAVTPRALDPGQCVTLTCDWARRRRTGGDAHGGGRRHAARGWSAARATTSAVISGRGVPPAGVVEDSIALTGAAVGGTPRVPVRGVAQPGSAPGSGPGSRRFKSSRPDKRRLASHPRGPSCFGVWVPRAGVGAFLEAAPDVHARTAQLGRRVARPSSEGCVALSDLRVPEWDGGGDGP